jgi:hypothetical protein
MATANYFRLAGLLKSLPGECLIQALKSLNRFGVEKTARQAVGTFGRRNQAAKNKKDHIKRYRRVVFLKSHAQLAPEPLGMLEIASPEAS